MSVSSNDDLCFTPANELAALIRKRELSPVELTEAVLDRIDRVGGQVNAYVTVVADQAREAAARAADDVVRLPAEELGALHGVPVSIKDLTPTKGIRTTYGSAFFQDHVPDEDAILVTRIRQAGAVLLGKTTTPEFGLHSVTEPELTGITRNPWNPERTVGGSSGGAAAAVAAGISPLATGSDGGGSIRVPAALCGVVGHKITPGLIPLLGDSSPWDNVTVVGPITRTVADNALLLDVMCGPDPMQPFSLPTRIDFTGALKGASVAGLCIAYSRDLGNGPVEPEVARVFEESLRALEQAGAHLEEVSISLPDPLEYFAMFWGPQSVLELGEVPREMLPPHIAEILDKSAQMSATDFVQAAFGLRGDIYQAFAQIFTGHDLFVWPTTKMTAFPHVGDLGGPTHVAGVEVVGYDGWSDASVRALQNQLFTEAVSHGGFPAITVPAGFSSDGLPVGLQIAAPQWADAAVLRAAAAFEAARPWAHLRPVL
ncbi:amidase [Kitasatospora cineracea]|uniref:Aspartyl-tRNA(Asn)/glutamyl-tRNA(Gln) amidotransferase subunit A n=1 Tax=Kitasatospora cineracea TaxID=88074 RepID=A0A8G1URI6_9ACTN|nr:amidase [Kitasatospora cineracea]ROR46509.1 aspartyl-tRNA(Asn)/glutamyl-tRNA(Gln) amidotransferase subunit A [Kitasatospora cineracea]